MPSRIHPLHTCRIQFKCQLAFRQGRPHTMLLSSCSEAWFSWPEHVWTAVWSQAGVYTTIYCRSNLAAINRLSRPTTSEPHQMPSRHLICNQRCRLYHLRCCHCLAGLFYCFTQVGAITFFLSPVDHCIVHRASSRTPHNRSPCRQ